METGEMKSGRMATKGATDSQVNDIGFRLILIPFFGVAIPLVTGLVNQQALSSWQVKWSYLYTIGISLLVWEGNRYLLFTLRSYYNWFNKPVRKLVVLVLSISCYTIPISILLLAGWYHLFLQGRVDWNVITETTLIIMVCVLFIVHVYETFFLVKESENEMLKNAQLERAMMQAELEALKDQIDPHFIFNSLNTLSHLIEEKPGKAKVFNDNLADVYRYILQNKRRELVLLHEELQFVEDYFSLLLIRFEEAVQLNMDIPADMKDRYLIPPISLQVLVENAIKHNEFSDMAPLVIDIRMEGAVLIIHNPVHRKSLRKPSSRIGLNNLDERYKLTMGKEIFVQSTDRDFTVFLPILNIA